MTDTIKQWIIALTSAEHPTGREYARANLMHCVEQLEGERDKAVEKSEEAAAVWIAGLSAKCDQLREAKIDNEYVRRKGRDLCGLCFHDSCRKPGQPDAS